MMFIGCKILQELKRIYTGILFTPETLNNVVYNLKERLVILQQQNGGRIEYLQPVLDIKNHII